MRNVLITGGAGFIGSHLAEALLAEGCEVQVLDDLSTGTRGNIAHLFDDPRFTFVRGTVTNRRVTAEMVARADVVISGELRTFTRPTASGGRSLGAFCPDCGTRIHNANAWAPDTISIKPGTLDDTSWLVPRGHIWRGSGQSWFVPPADQPVHDGQTVSSDIFSLETPPSKPT